MSDPVKITAIVGSYRKGHTIDRTVDEILAAAQKEGAEVSKIWLMDKHIEFCNNCRSCCQKEGIQRGECVFRDDDMNSILDQIEKSDGLIFACPVNFYTITAVMKRFVERLICYTYWSWGMWAPKFRLAKHKNKRAVLVAASAAPGFWSRLTTPAMFLLNKAADTLGAKSIGSLFVGLVSQEPNPPLSERVKKNAQKLGRKLAAIKRK